jgi:hypothetical protein
MKEDMVMDEILYVSVNEEETNNPFFRGFALPLPDCCCVCAAEDVVAIYWQKRTMWNQNTIGMISMCRQRKKAFDRLHCRSSRKAASRH